MNRPSATAHFFTQRPPGLAKPSQWIRSAAMLVTLLLAACGEQPLDGATLAAEKGCVACHGLDGRGTAPIYPNLNGQWERYLRQQLLAYRSGRRDNGIMNGFASGLSDAEIRALAAYYAR
jgi:cytochrome c553